MQVYVSGRIQIRRAGKRVVVHARRRFFKSHRYDFVRISGAAGEMWAARLMGLIRVYLDYEPPRVTKSGWIPLVIVQWLQRTEDALPGMPTFKYLQRSCAISPEAIEARLKVVEMPRKTADETSPLLVAIPYGKSALFNEDVDNIV